MSPTVNIEPQDWMTASATRAVVAALSADGAAPRFVGGCVRDALLDRPVKDVDIATPDPPACVVALLERAGLKAVPTGIAHGTVTAVSAGRPYEVTSLRIDVETYGRHAKVAFTDDWQADAARRDLTINALSCTPDGRVFDYFGGIADLKAGRVRFVGDPRARIREDYLRLLRFFRFHAHYGRGTPDPEGLAAAGELASEATKLSGERVREELLRLLMAPAPVAVLDIMVAEGVLEAFLPEAVATGSLAALMQIRPDVSDGLLRLAALLPPRPAIGEAVAARLRFSRVDGARLVALLEAPDWAADQALVPDGFDLRNSLYRLGATVTGDRLRLAWARKGAEERTKSRAALDAALAAAADWQPRSFPLKGGDAVRLGVPAGPQVGRALARVEEWWIGENFAPDRDACLAKLEQLAGGA